MLMSFHLADLPRRLALRAQRHPDQLVGTPGLLHAEVALAAPLTGQVLPRPNLGRLVLVASWDDDASIDRFLATHPFAAAMADGWQVRLEPMRATGSWPGLPDDLPSGRDVAPPGPVVVLTLGELRAGRAPSFLRHSARAGAQLADAPGMLWATGLGRVPFVGTCSVWRDAASTRAYAYGSPGSSHGVAMEADRRNPFHHRAAFIRSRPYAASGLVDGRDPLEGRCAAPVGRWRPDAGAA